MKPAISRSTASPGFTLVETLVVMVVSVGLVILMAVLYRTVGQAALSLRGGDADWMVENLLRNQLAHGLKFKGQPWIQGSGNELTLLTWNGRVNKLDGKPVIANYQFDPVRRTLMYRESSLPPWWSGTRTHELVTLAASLKSVEPVAVMGAIASLEFNFVPAGANDLDPAFWQSTWHQETEPQLIVLRFNRNRDNTVWMELSSIEAD